MPENIVNIATGNDVVALQVGAIIAAPEDTPPRPTETVAEPTEPATVTVVNIRAGNARVGAQIDELHIGDLHL